MGGWGPLQLNEEKIEVAGDVNKTVIFVNQSCNEFISVGFAKTVCPSFGKINVISPTIDVISHNQVDNCLF